MRLSEKEKEILSAAQLQADATTGTIGKLTSSRNHTVRYTLQKALDAGLICRRAFFNLFLLGFTQYEVYFSLSTNRKNLRSSLLQALTEADNVSWVGEFSGEYHYGFNICVRSVAEVAEFLDRLATKLDLSFLEKAFASRLSLTFFGNKYLSKKPSQAPELCYRATNKYVEIDEIDHLVLKTMMDHNSGSRRELARATALPYSTLEYRLKKLEQSKVICGYYLHIKEDLLGVLSFLCLVSVKGFNQTAKKKFFTFCRNHPAITVFIESLGSWDYELAVEVENPRQMLALTQDLQDNFGSQLQSIKVLPSFSYPKVREYPFISFPWKR